MSPPRVLLYTKNISLCGRIIVDVVENTREREKEEQRRAHSMPPLNKSACAQAVCVYEMCWASPACGL